MRFQDFICGLFAGWSQIVFGQPFDYIKVKLQTQSSSTQNNKNKSILKIARQINNQHGLKGFYRGSSSLFFGFAFTIGMEFAVYEYSKRFIYGFRTNNSNNNSNNLNNNLNNSNNNSNNNQNKSIFEYTDSSLNILDVALAGAFVGLSISTIICPVQYVKIQKQLNPSIKKGSFLLLLQQLKTNGIKTISKGLSATILRETIGSAVYYGGYQYMLRFMTNNERQKARTFDYILCGGIGGLAYWLVSYPFDVVKTKVQNGENYKNAFKALMTSSYKGFSVVFIRSLLVNGMSFGVYQHTKKFFQYLKYKQVLN